MVLMKILRNFYKKSKKLVFVFKDENNSLNKKAILDGWPSSSYTAKKPSFIGVKIHLFPSLLD